MEYAIGSCLWILVYLWASVTLVKKAGLSGWYVVLLVLPGIGVIGFFIVAFRDWPVVQEVRELRLRCRVGSEEDARALLDRAVRLEVKGFPEAASEKYELVVEGMPESESAKAAEARLRELFPERKTNGELRSA